jgi:hypothetical protein
MPVIKNEQNIEDQNIAIYIEVDKLPDNSVYQNMRGVSDNILSAARDLFGDGLQLINACAARVVKNINEIDETTKPDEFEVQLAIKLDSQLGAVLAKMGTEAQMQVTMKWINRDK